MQLQWIEPKDYGMYAEPMASAHLRIVALFLMAVARASRPSHQWLNADAVAVLHNYACFRQFSLEAMISFLQEQARSLRPEDVDDHLQRIAFLTIRQQQLEAIHGAFDLLVQHNAVCEVAWEMLHRAARAFSLPDDDLEKLYGKYFSD